MKIWDTRTGAEIATLRGQPPCAFSPDGSTLVSGVSGGNNQTLTLWNVNTGDELGVLEAHAAVTGCVFTPDGRAIVSSSDDCLLRLWDATTASGAVARPEHRGPVRTCITSPDGRCVASAGGDREIKLWDVSTGLVRADIRAHEGAVLACVFDPHGRLVASAGDDQTIAIWNAQTGMPV